MNIMNFPNVISNVEFLVIRNVKYFSSTAILIVLTECYPQLGRTWVNFYRSSWTGWFQKIS